MFTHKVNNTTYYVHTNWQTRELVPFSEVPESVRLDQFDYVTNTSDDDYNYDCRFFQYRGEWYDTLEFEHGTHDIKALRFDAYQTQSVWSAIVIQYWDRDGELHNDGNSIVVGYIHW